MYISLRILNFEISTGSTFKFVPALFRFYVRWFVPTWRPCRTSGMFPFQQAWGEFEFKIVAMPYDRLEVTDK